MFSSTTTIFLSSKNFCLFWIIQKIKYKLFYFGSFTTNSTNIVTSWPNISWFFITSPTLPLQDYAHICHIIPIHYHSAFLLALFNLYTLHFTNLQCIIQCFFNIFIEDGIHLYSWFYNIFFIPKKKNSVLISNYSLFPLNSFSSRQPQIYFLSLHLPLQDMTYILTHNIWSFMISFFYIA